jgi:hypothetical protein
MRQSGSMATIRSAVWPERRAMAAKNVARRYDTIRESLHVQPLMRQAPRTRVSVASTISMVSEGCIVVLLSSDRLPEVRSVGEAHIRSSRPGVPSGAVRIAPRKCQIPRSGHRDRWCRHSPTVPIVQAWDIVPRVATHRATWKRESAARLLTMVVVWLSIVRSKMRGDAKPTVTGPTSHDVPALLLGQRRTRLRWPWRPPEPP